jgi:hypothetical protein
LYSDSGFPRSLKFPWTSILRKISPEKPAFKRPKKTFFPEKSQNSKIFVDKLEKQGL